MLKKTALFFAVFYSIWLLVVSLIKLDKLPQVEVHYGDKIFHFFAYMILSFLWFYASLYQFKLNKKSALAFGLVFSVLFGIVIEVFQSVFTSYRNLDVYDIASNSFGALFMIIILAININRHIKKT